MSLLDGLNNYLNNPLLDAIEEAEIDDELDFEFALEAAVDEVTLNDSDIQAILRGDDDVDPDSDYDIEDEDECVGNIGDSLVDSMESYLGSILSELASLD